MHKKIVALFALVALVCGAMFADVAVKALDGDNVEVTFTIKAHLVFLLQNISIEIGFTY